MYSNNHTSRPNNSVNAVVGLLILKELFNLTDDELLASILCDVRFQYAPYELNEEEGNKFLAVINDNSNHARTIKLANILLSLKIQSINLFINK